MKMGAIHIRLGKMYSIVYCVYFVAIFNTILLI